MKVLITGTAGRIGRLLATKLLERGDSVVGYDAARSTIEHPHFKGIENRFSNLEALKEACQGIDAVLHMGAYMTWNPDEQPKLFEANVTGPDLYYETNAGKAKEILGFEPQWTFQRMVEDV